jgi:hypothetical protein
MESTATTDMAAALAKAMTNPNHRNAKLGLIPVLVARKNVFERMPFRTSLKSVSVKLPTNCMFVVAPIDALRPASHSKGLYAQEAQSSSFERLRVLSAETGQATITPGRFPLLRLIGHQRQL